MTNKIKLVALDIDGTIMNSQFHISDAVKKSIKRVMDSGVYVVLATGRMYSATVPIASGLGITTPLITYQGSMVREFYESDDILLHYTLPSDLAHNTIDDLRKFNSQINVYLDDELFVENESEILVEYAQKRHILYHKVNAFNKIIDLKATKILAIEKDPEKANEVKSYLQKKYQGKLNITKSMPKYCEIVNNEASKGNAVLFLAKMWNIKQSEILAVGDQDNDKDMLEVAGISVAMGNSPNGLKDFADYVTDTVDNDGAALAIEKFVLE